MLSVSYWSCVLAAGVAAAIRLMGQPGRPNAAVFVGLFFFACATAPLKVKLPGVDRSVSLSFVFSFAAITELPPGYGFFIVALALLYEELVDVEITPRWEGMTFKLACAAVATLCAYTVYAQLENELASERLLLLEVVAATYYFISSAAGAVHIGLQSRTAPWKVWHDRFFWTAPLYMLAPLGVHATKMLQSTSGTSGCLVGLAAIFLGYRYVKHYYARLHDQEDHAHRLNEIRQRAIESLAVAIEAKDGGTAGHLQRVKRHAVRLARELQFSEMEIRSLELAAVLHDVGKVGVPDYILGKPGRLTEQEFSQLAAHSTVGAQIVSAVQFPGPVEEVVLSHHEHWDGSGYPRQLVGPQIPRLARVLTVVDCFDALVTDRPYRPALSVPNAVQILRAQREKIFDPTILDKFLEGLPAFVEDLERELEQERASRRLSSGPVRKVRQTWLAEAESNEIARHRQTLEKLASSPEQLVSLYEILQVLGADLEIQQSLRKTLAILRRIIPYDQAAVFVLEKDDYLLLHGEEIPEYCVSCWTVPTSDSLLGQAAAARKPIVAEGPPVAVPAGLAARCLHSVRSTLAASLLANEETIGAVLLYSRTPKRFDHDQAWFLGLITGKLAAAVASSRALQKLRHDASTDPVTSLANARAAFQRLESEIKRARRENTSLAVLFFDLNRFKSVNDTYGHSLGDKLLISVAQRLKERLRSYDFVGRIGGDEFLAILPGIAGESLRGKVEAVRQAVAENVVTAADGTGVATTISIGVACYPDDGADAEDLIVCSDERMYLDKRNAASREAELRQPGSPRSPETASVLQS